MTNASNLPIFFSRLFDTLFLSSSSLVDIVGISEDETAWGYPVLDDGASCFLSVSSFGSAKMEDELVEGMSRGNDDANDDGNDEVFSLLDASWGANMVDSVIKGILLTCFWVAEDGGFPSFTPEEAGCSTRVCVRLMSKCSRVCAAVGDGGWWFGDKEDTLEGVCGRNKAVGGWEARASKIFVIAAL